MIFNKEIKPASKLLCTILNTIYLIKYLISLGHCPHFAWNKHGITCLYIYYLFERKHLSIMNIFRNFIRDNSTSWPVVREVHIEFFNNQILKKMILLKTSFIKLCSKTLNTVSPKIVTCQKYPQILTWKVCE